MAQYTKSLDICGVPPQYKGTTQSPFIYCVYLCVLLHKVPGYTVSSPVTQYKAYYTKSLHILWIYSMSLRTTTQSLWTYCAESLHTVQSVIHKVLSYTVYIQYVFAYYYTKSLDIQCRVPPHSTKRNTQSPFIYCLYTVYFRVLHKVPGYTVWSPSTQYKAYYTKSLSIPWIYPISLRPIQSPWIGCGYTGGMWPQQVV